MTRPILASALALACVLASGCATTAPREGSNSPIPSGPSGASNTPIPTPAPTSAPTSPMPGTPVGSTASGGTITSTNGRPTVRDTLPSADARTVLQTIPEPLPPGQRVPPRVSRTSPASESEPDAAAAPMDTTASDAEGDVPVPEPTRPLGDRPRPAVRDSMPPVSPSPSPTPAPAPPSQEAPASPARSDSCWRVQVAAVPESDRAERLKGAAESQLDVRCVVEKEKTLYKVRSRDCQDAAAADRLRKRAIAVGFSGAFRFRDAK